MSQSQRKSQKEGFAVKWYTQPTAASGGLVKWLYMIGNQVICYCILLWSQNHSKRATFQFHSIFRVLFFFSKLSICEISFMGAKAVFNRNQIRLQKYLNPFCISTRKSSNKYKGKEKPLGA